MNRLDQRLTELGTPLLGAAVYQYNPAFVEICAQLGYQAIWFEMEHAPLNLSQIIDLCRIASGLGLLTMIRVSNGSRQNVLRAAECGPDIIDLPMGNTPAEMRELVSNARFAPHGSRGFFGASRAVRYGIPGDMAAEQRRINEELCLLSQIETREAVDAAEQLCAVPGIDGIFIGPGDLSASYGVPGQTAHPDVEEAISRTVATAKQHCKRVALMVKASDVGRWAAQGVDLFFCTSDIACLRVTAQSVSEQFRMSLNQSAPLSALPGVPGGS
jgi:4-hydroxy-2-oxoheptanedioate aldolase